MEFVLRVWLFFGGFAGVIRLRLVHEVKDRDCSSSLIFVFLAANDCSGPPWISDMQLLRDWNMGNL